jgi:meso-butanediol dehydrogenase / (S,S)-butanediol dehydrogenase / diacetyl reductase
MTRATQSQFSLEGRVALVTGGGRGIGAGIPQSLGKSGADVIVADYDVKLAEEGAAAVRVLGRRAAAIVVDSASPKASAPYSKR